MTTRTASQIGKANLAKSKRDEGAVAAYYRETGAFPDAERAVRTGFKSISRIGADPGDVANTPGVITSVKSWEDMLLVERSVPGWLDELDRMQDATWSLDTVRLLVVRRYRKPDPGDWWVFLRLRTLLLVTAERLDLDQKQTVRMLLRDFLPLLQAGGWGIPEEAS